MGWNIRYGPRGFACGFPDTENPVSQDGRWKHAANSWQRLKSENGRLRLDAYTESYDDGYAFIDNISPNVEIEVTIYKAGTAFGEFEILFRCADTSGSPGTMRAYECLCESAGQSYPVRWNGGLGDFTLLSGVNYAAYPVLLNGDKLKASMVGDLMTLWHGRSGVFTRIWTCVDSTFTDGGAGVAFFIHTPQAMADLGYSDFKLTELS